jgi:hypothetical protein
VRRLADAGRLPARKLGHDWIFDGDLLSNAMGVTRQRGRPFSQESALGVLFLASGEDPPWLSGRSRARLRRLSESSILRVLPRLRSRGDRQPYRAPASLVRRLSDDPGFVVSGVSASDHYAMRIVSKGVLEGYLDRRRRRELEHRYALEPVNEREANLIAHWVDGHLLPQARVMPKAVVAADLADSEDERSRGVGRQLLRGSR